MFYDTPSKRLNVALSSSNHGRDEEIFVAAFSFNPLHAQYTKSSLNLASRRKEAISYSLDIDYRFCVVDREDYRHYGKDIHSEIINSFYKSFQRMSLDLDSTELFVERELQKEEKEKIKVHLKRILHLPYPAVCVHPMIKRDCKNGVKTNPLLIFADYQSNKLFRSSRFETADPAGSYFPNRVSFPLI